MALFDVLRELFVGMPQRLLPSGVDQCVAAIRSALTDISRKDRENPFPETEAIATPRPPAKTTPSDRGTSSIRFMRVNVKSDVASIRHEYGVQMDRKRRPPDQTARNLTFSAQLLQFVRDRCGGVGPVAYKRAGIDRRRYSRIISDNSAHADKETVMRFTIGLQLTRAEADRLMSAAGYSFSPSIPADCVFLYCIDHGIWNIEDVDEILAAVR